jgi:hypothetical protein
MRRADNNHWFGIVKSLMMENGFNLINYTRTKDWNIVFVPIMIGSGMGIY